MDDCEKKEKSKHVYSTYLLLGFVVIIFFGAFVSSLTTYDIDYICNQDNNSLIRVNGIWTCYDISKDYAEGYYYNSTGGGTPYIIDIITSGVFYNLTEWTPGDYSGFIWEGNGVTSSKDSLFKITGTITFSGEVSDEYSLMIFKNDVIVPKCGMGMTVAKTRENMAISCLIELEEGDHLNLRIADKNSPAKDANIYKSNFNIIEI